MANRRTYGVRFSLLLQVAEFKVALRLRSRLILKDLYANRTPIAKMRCGIYNALNPDSPISKAVAHGRRVRGKLGRTRTGGRGGQVSRGGRTLSRIRTDLSARALAQPRFVHCGMSQRRLAGLLVSWVG